MIVPEKILKSFIMMITIKIIQEDFNTSKSFSLTAYASSKKRPHTVKLVKQLYLWQIILCSTLGMANYDTHSWERQWASFFYVNSQQTANDTIFLRQWRKIRFECSKQIETSNLELIVRRTCFILSVSIIIYEYLLPRLVSVVSIFQVLLKVLTANNR